MEKVYYNFFLGVLKFRSFESEIRSSGTFEAPTIGRDICRGERRANFLSPDAQFLGFRRDRPPSAPFWADALGVRQLPESFLGSSEVAAFRSFEV